MKVVISPSTNSKKKYMAVFTDSPSFTKKTVHFGSAGMSDFTKNKDEERKQRYLDRHRKNENWDSPTTAGSLSRYVLWNLPTLRASIKDYKRRFKLMLSYKWLMDL